MDLTLILIGVVVMAIAIWVFAELKRFSHRIFAVVLIIAVLLIYSSFAFVSLSKQISLSGFDKVKEAGGIYLSWIGTVFQNFIALTGNAAKMNWSPNNITSNLTNIAPN